MLKESMVSRLRCVLHTVGGEQHDLITSKANKKRQIPDLPIEKAKTEKIVDSLDAWRDQSCVELEHRDAKQQKPSTMIRTDHPSMFKRFIIHCVNEISCDLITSMLLDSRNQAHIPRRVSSCTSYGRIGQPSNICTRETLGTFHHYVDVFLRLRNTHR
jgi:hypothetical protein